MSSMRSALADAMANRIMNDGWSEARVLETLKESGWNSAERSRVMDMVREYVKEESDVQH